MGQVKRAYYIIDIGVMQATATFDARLQCCKNSNFNAGVTNLTNSNLTQVLTNNTVVTIEVRADQVVAQVGSAQFVRLNTTVGTAAAFYGAIGLGVDSIQRPASQYLNTTVVAQQVVVS